MHGASLKFANQYKQLQDPEVLIATDMLDLATFLSVANVNRERTKVILYMHENQLTYPVKTGDKRDNRFAFLNITSMLVADEIWFNSQFHKNDCLGAIAPFFSNFPDKTPKALLDTIPPKSKVVPIGIMENNASRIEQDRPNIVWNHRWEFDKNPDDFFRILFSLSKQGLDFSLTVLGQRFRQSPEIFDQAKRQLEKHIVHWGYAESRQEYDQLLANAHIAPTTATHDYFGIAVLEAIAAGSHPLLPKRLAYPEHIAKEFHGETFYETSEELEQKLAELIATPKLIGNYASQAAKYSWNIVAPTIDDALSKIIKVAP